jgi:H+/Cl- antiporter ClcA
VTEVQNHPEAFPTASRHHAAWLRLAGVWPIWRRGLRHLSLRENTLFLLLAVVIGLFSGLAVVCLRITMDWTRLWLLGPALYPALPRVVLAPLLGGLVVAFLVMWLFPRARGSGVNQTKEAVSIYDGYIPFNTVIGKFLTCSLAIGSGQSLGPEDPSLSLRTDTCFAFSWRAGSSSPPALGNTSCSIRLPCACSDITTKFLP